MIEPLELPKVFTAEECRLIVADSPGCRFADAAMVGGVRADATRRSRVCWLDEEVEADWAFRRMLETIAESNRNHFNFVIEDYAERMQLAWYVAEHRGRFDWHIDYGSGPIARRRKLTMVVQLSESKSYAGGHLQTNADGVVRRASRRIGSALLMPSFMLHRVTPVRVGERYSLTLWCHGPPFR